MVDQNENSNHRKFATAIEAGDLKAIAAILDQEPEIVNCPDWTLPPLHCAILWNRPGVAELLLDRGADIEMFGPDRQTTPLPYAIMYCKTEFIPMLLSRNPNTGPVEEGGSSAVELARRAAKGEFSEFEDLPRPLEYEKVIACLEKAGLE